VLTKIPVPLDGSGLAEQALTYASALATPTGAHLRLLRAAFSHTLIGVAPRERQTRALQEAEHYLERIAASLRERGLSCETLFPYGHAAECIADEARRRGAELIVMATHGRTGPGRWIFGSVTESLVASSSVPVLVQRSWQHIFGDPLWRVQPELLVTVDGSAFAETALEPAANLAESLGTRLALVRSEDDPRRISEAMSYLVLVQARLAGHHPVLAIVTDIRLGETVHGIEEALIQRRPALVVMATHGYGGAARTIIGSVAGKIVQRGSRAGRVDSPRSGRG
jgi:nucleotide-binding universal stress UspA family protein